MPSRDNYHHTSDGCLEKWKPGEKNRQSLEYSSINLIENNFDVNTDNGYDWLKETGMVEVPDAALGRKRRRENLVNSQQWQKMLAAYPFDHISTPMFLEDVPLELGDTVAAMFAPVNPSLEVYVDAGYEDLMRGSYFGHSSLSISEKRALRELAMPSYVLPDVTTVEEGEICYSPKSETQVCYKRRQSSIAREGGDSKCLQQIRKQEHRVIEKRYRIDLNDRIAALRQCLPGMRTPLDVEQVIGDAEKDEKPGLTAAHKLAKGAVLTGAVEYIASLERNVTQLNTESAALKTRLAAFEKLVSSGSMVLRDSSW